MVDTLTALPDVIMIASEDDVAVAQIANGAERKPGWIDFDAGLALNVGMEAAAEALLDRIVAIASGEPARNESNDERSIGIWKLGVIL